MTHDINIPHGYKATALGIIPQEWEVKRIKDFGPVITGNTPSTLDSENYGGYYMFVSPADLSEDAKYIITTEKTLSDKGFSQARKIPKGSILFTCIGSTIGKIGIASQDLATNQQINSVVTNGEYLFYALSFQSNKIRILANEQAVPIINKSDFERIKVAFPPLAEQRKIAEVLGVWDEAIEKQARLIEKLALRKRGLMQRLLTGKLRLPNFNEEWRNTIFSSVIEKMSNGYTYDVNGVGNVPITRIETISKGIIDYSKVGNVLYVDELEKYKLHRGDILFSHINSIEHIGKVAIFEGDEDLYHGMNLLLIRTKEVMSNIYLYYFLSSPIAIRKVRSLAKKAVNQASISIAELKKLVIYIPEIKEQTAIAEVLTAADREIELAKEKLEYLRRQKRGLMQQLLTGKKRVKY